MAPEVGLRFSSGFGEAGSGEVPVVQIKQTTVTQKSITDLHTEKGLSADQAVKICSVPGKIACGQGEEDPNIPEDIGCGLLCLLRGKVRWYPGLSQLERKENLPQPTLRPSAWCALY